MLMVKNEPSSLCLDTFANPRRLPVKSLSGTSLSALQTHHCRRPFTSRLPNKSIGRKSSEPFAENVFFLFLSYPFIMSYRCGVVVKDKALGRSAKGQKGEERHDDHQPDRRRERRGDHGVVPDKEAARPTTGRGDRHTRSEHCLTISEKEEKKTQWSSVVRQETLIKHTTISAAATSPSASTHVNLNYKIYVSPPLVAQKKTCQLTNTAQTHPRTFSRSCP